MTTKPETQQLERLATAHADAARRLQDANQDVAYFSKRVEEAQEAAIVAYQAARIAERDLMGFAAAQFPTPPVLFEDLKAPPLAEHDEITCSQGVTMCQECYAAAGS